MEWTRSDEELSEALALDQRLSANGEVARQSIFRTSYPCLVHKVTLVKPRLDAYYWKMPRRAIADPLNPWFLFLLLCWIPVNVVYVSFQLLRHLSSYRNTWSPSWDSMEFGPRQLTFSRRRNPGGGTEQIAYQSITSIGYYANGVRIDRGTARMLVRAESAPLIFVALRHFAPHARVTSGLIGPADFAERLAAAGRHLDEGQLLQNPPATWTSRSRDYRPPLPLPALVGMGISGLLMLAFVALLVRG